MRRAVALALAAVLVFSLGAQAFTILQDKSGQWLVAFGDRFPTSADINEVPPVGTRFYRIDTFTEYYWTGTAWTAMAAGGVWGAITGTLSNQTDLQTALDARIDGTLVATRIPFASDANTVTTDIDLTFESGDTLKGTKIVAGRDGGGYIVRHAGSNDKTCFLYEANSNGGAVLCDSGGYLGFVASATPTPSSFTMDTFMTRESAAVFQFGVDTSSPVAYTLKAGDQGVSNDQAGASLTLASGTGRGTGAVTSVSIQTPDLAVAGATQQTLATRAIFNSTGVHAFKGADVLSAATITATGNLFHVTSTNSVTDMTVASAGTCVTIIFDGILTFTDGNHLKLAGNMTTSADDTISLCSDGTNWYETARSVN